ncbi:hypothetical protein [Umezawaea sp. NPDC059074]|uniref:hypothetical protein n=1 Tax=Umezawaea sp. NPDC059074 TaxID=3346716 RepID=UPI0036BF6B49
MRKLLIIAVAVLGTGLLSGCEGDGGVESTSTVDSAVRLVDPPRNGARPTPAEDDPDWDCTLHGNRICNPWPGHVNGWGVGL